MGYAPKISREKARITTASGTEVAPVITLDAVEALGLRKKKVKTMCHDLPPQATVSVLLGLDFLRGSLTELNLKEGELDIRDP